MGALLSDLLIIIPNCGNRQLQLRFAFSTVCTKLANNEYLFRSFSGERHWVRYLQSTDHTDWMSTKEALFNIQKVREEMWSERAIFVCSAVLHLNWTQTMGFHFGWPPLFMFSTFCQGMTRQLKWRLKEDCRTKIYLICSATALLTKTMSLLFYVVQVRRPVQREAVWSGLQCASELPQPAAADPASCPGKVGRSPQNPEQRTNAEIEMQE